MKINKKILQEVITEEISNYLNHSKLRSLGLLLEALEDPEWKPHLSPEERDALQTKVLSYHEDHWKKKGAAWAPEGNEWENDPPWPFSTDAQEVENLNNDEVEMFQKFKNSFGAGSEEYLGEITPQHLKFADELGGQRLKIELDKIEDELTAKYPEAESSIINYIDDFYHKLELAFLEMKRSEGRKMLGFYAKFLKRADDSEKESLQEKKKITKMTKQQLREIIYEEVKKFKGIK